MYMSPIIISLIGSIILNKSSCMTFINHHCIVVVFFIINIIVSAGELTMDELDLPVIVTLIINCVSPFILKNCSLYNYLEFLLEYLRHLLPSISIRVDDVRPSI